ncbi:MAG: YfbU family protein [Hylemonella sp.]|nr:YfbU family protein [Hylemonella sp.]MDP1938460.1 YfbU family protein [Hylemonella sp.]
MKLKNSEKLILLMLSDIYDKLGMNEINTRLLKSAIYSENTWALDWEMQGVVGSDAEPTPPLVAEVINYLDMWSFIEDAHAGFAGPERLKVEKEAEPFGKYVRFPGFDGNNESEMLGIARILIEDMGRFGRFKGRDLNSHVPMRHHYAEMFRVFEPIRLTLTAARSLSPDQLVEILQVQHRS